MAYATETDLSLQQVIRDSQLVHQEVRSFMFNEDLKKLEDALYYAENIKILLERIINTHIRALKEEKKENA